MFLLFKWSNSYLQITIITSKSIDWQRQRKWKISLEGNDFFCIMQNLRGFPGIKLSRWNNSEGPQNFACYELYLHTHLFLCKDLIQKLNAKQDYAIEMDGWCCFTISGKTFIVSFPYSSWLLRGLCCTYTWYSPMNWQSFLPRCLFTENH